MILRHKLLNLQTGRIIYKQPEYAYEFVNIKNSFLVPPPSIILVATAATPIIMISAATSAVMVTVATPVVLVVIVVPTVAVLWLTARS